MRKGSSLRPDTPLALFAPEADSLPPSRGVLPAPPPSPSEITAPPSPPRPRARPARAHKPTPSESLPIAPAPSSSPPNVPEFRVLARLLRRTAERVGQVNYRTQRNNELIRAGKHGKALFAVTPDHQALIDAIPALDQGRLSPDAARALLARPSIATLLTPQKEW